jgi:hypothetical protein
MERVSLSLDEVRSIKKYTTRDASYAVRVSLGFAVALAHLGEVLGEDHHVLHEINVLEGACLEFVDEGIRAIQATAFASVLAQALFDGSPFDA